jgi:hypothetical protein
MQMTLNDNLDNKFMKDSEMLSSWLNLESKLQGTSDADDGGCML